ncbi:proteasome subunit beta [Candidatus Woesearchaeota archaeon]|nr:MAG: proteasome subunit beta [Candidatus Woesearchaeota archaeon]
MEGNQNVMKTGTTTVGILCKDGVVLAADRRATIGNFIADKKAKKIHEITPEIAVTISGSVSDAQLIIKVLKANINLKNIATRRKASVKEVANFLAGIIYSSVRRLSPIPSISHFIMGGIAKEGFALFDIFADGSLTEIEDFVASGSGSVTAYGVLESDYKKGLSVDEGVKLAVKAVNAALRRDTASGSGLEVVTITKDGIKKVIEKEIKVDLTK